MSGHIRRRDEALYEACAPPVEYTADEAQGSASSYSYPARYIGVFFITSGLCAGEGNPGVLTKNMCGVYHRCNTVYYQWFAAGDAGCVQCKGQTEESSDERLCAGSAGIIVLYRRYYYHCGAGE